MGLNPHRDRLCVVQMSGGDGHAHLVQVAKGQTEAPNLCRMLADPGRAEAVPLRPLRHRRPAERLWRADRAGLLHQDRQSKLIRTYTDRHGLKYLLQELVGVDISKQQQISDWGAETLTEAQLDYAASDVLYLHQLREELNERLDARRPHRSGAGLFRLPADARSAGSRRVA